MLKETYALLMSPNKNPLRHLPKIVRFQFMTTLAFMWSLIFTLWIGSIAYFGPSVIIHLLILIGVFFTADVFRKAKKNKE
ncbi:MAG: hypothetical protein P8L69_00735 [Alphaproteobacteria bacterium]|jgi:uncharacterized membrane protein|nr:hypothetical protein [Alphaproteobacteria bacterium]|tara:strand:- start:555 stop:794 length:240 start_codon:yes stop_codon:yes gene_type:complete